MNRFEFQGFFFQIMLNQNKYTCTKEKCQKIKEVKMIDKKVKCCESLKTNQKKLNETKMLVIMAIQFDDSTPRIKSRKVAVIWWKRSIY